MMLACKLQPAEWSDHDHLAGGGAHLYEGEVCWGGLAAPNWQGTPCVSILKLCDGLGTPYISPSVWRVAGGRKFVAHGGLWSDTRTAGTASKFRYKHLTQHRVLVGVAQTISSDFLFKLSSMFFCLRS